jgi:ComF family protein
MRVLDFIYPRRCVLCGEPLLPGASPAYPLCTACRTSLHSIQAEKRCSICSRPLISETNLCMYCRKRSFPFEKNLSVYHYQDEIKELIYRYKFKYKLDLAHLFAEKLYILYTTAFSDVSIVPVPAAGETVRKRGFDHMQHISLLMKKKYGIQTLSLLKKKKTAPQKTLDPQRRFSNLQGNIVLKPRNNSLPKRVVLVDDVFTTGSTLSVCASVLKSGGISSVFCLTLALD